MRTVIVSVVVTMVSSAAGHTPPTAHAMGMRLFVHFRLQNYNRCMHELLQI